MLSSPQAFGIHRPLNSLARSLDSLHCLFSFTFCHLSLVISHSVHGSSLPQLSLSHSTMEFMAGARTRTHKHMSVIQKYDLASREFFFPGYLDRLKAPRFRSRNRISSESLFDHHAASLSILSNKAPGRETGDEMR